MNQQPQLVPLQPGDYLKNRRLERKLSLEDVSAEVRLDKSLLADIEADRVLTVAKVYRDGYIKTYARYLAVPETKIDSLLASFVDSDPGVHNIFSAPARRNPADSWLRATSYVLASLLIGTLAWQFTHEAVRLSQSAPELQQAVPDTPVAEQGSAQQGYDNTVKASITSLGVLHDGNPAQSDPAEQAWQALARPALLEGESSLQISVSADSWVEITDGSGQELEMDLLRGGSDKYYHGTPPFKILVGRASAVRLMIDGQPMDLSLFSREDVAQFSWPQDVRAIH